ncbi:S9 family peptidase [Aliidiomarina halalkaliphila]|uniref:S9 family peptidase n=1 Tax=Aliidiomarina halalkaliphila TaxID=2593535 RepID=A0A552X4Y6_9GAMM|nr:prolyl oligopeptidase family serine peptidase [Aliidiomarina halalkaliphila]TRW50009.1 S9 family peptidase [Aliidiomarina halalkaliphila]
MMKRSQLHVVAAALVAVLGSSAALAVDKGHIRVHAVDQGNSLITIQDSQQQDSVRDSLVQPWLNDFSDGGYTLTAVGSEAPAYVLRVPLRVDRFTQGTLEFNELEQVTAYLNGKRVNVSGGKLELNIQTGDHKLVVLAENVSDWSGVDFSWSGKADHDLIDSSWPEQWRLSQQQMFDATTVNSLELSADGRFLVWRESGYSPATGNTAERNLVIRDLNEGRIAFRVTDPSASQFAWHPHEHSVAYVSGQRIQVLSLEDLSLRTVSDELTGVNGLRWLNDTQLVFNWSKTGEKDNELSKRYQALEDRWSAFRNNSQVFALNTETKALRQLTSAANSIGLLDVHESGERILLSQRQVDYAAPPHFIVDVFELNLNTGERHDFGSHRTFNSAFYVNNDVYMVAGPEFGDGAGRDPRLPEDKLSNNYDGQLYQVGRDGSIRGLSRSFDPAINGAMALGNGDILLRVTERDGTQLYRYNPQRERFMGVSSDIEVVEQVAASTGPLPRIVFSGSSVTAPQKVVQLDVAEGRLQTLWDSKEKYFGHNVIVPVEPWNFTNKHGDTIEGRVYYPPNFDANNSYPALVYYYGGTTPVQRGFTGRYPFNQWAAQGYVVYVLQPTGAIGYGQHFSARHVNAWGEYTAEDIIQGTNEFLAAHSFVDADRVGHLGASYGGFMTMLLATMTDIYAASMSHAGISAITSYWGQGWWGFLYSGEASKNSFPWNNRDLYVGQSPVYRADKVTNPMLLIHGDADTNVPPGESHNMYTALKLLGRDVELVEYMGQDHHILGRDARFHWWDTYMAFFDKHLKDQPEWWNHLYPERD